MPYAGDKRLDAINSRRRAFSHNPPACNKVCQFNQGAEGDEQKMPVSRRTPQFLTILLIPRNLYLLSFVISSQRLLPFVRGGRVG